MKEETKKKIRKFIIIILVILLISTIYNVGRFRGLIDGLYLSEERHNSTICDLMNKTRDSDGFCLLLEEPQKYRYYVDCGYEKFKIEGNRRPPFLLSFVEDIRKWALYPMIGC